VERISGLLCLLQHRFQQAKGYRLHSHIQDEGHPYLQADRAGCIFRLGYSYTAIDI